MKSRISVALFSITIAAWALPAQASDCPVRIAEYFLIGSGQKLLQYQVTLRSPGTGMSVVTLAAQGTGVTRRATFNADFEPDPLVKFPVPREYNVVVLFPWDRNLAPSMALEVNGVPCSDSVGLKQNDVDPTPVPFDDAGIAIGQDLSVSVVSQNAFVERVAPRYPEAAKEQGVSGSVVLAVVVGMGGRVISSWILQTSHSNLLDNAALEAARASRFQEPQSGGRPVVAAYRIEYNFSL